MQANTRKISEGAMMIALFTIFFFITVYIPVLGFATFFFIPLPIFLYRLRYDRKATIFVAIVATIVGTMISGVLSAPFVLMFSLIGWAIGENVAAGKSKLATVMSVATIFLITLVIVYVLTIQLFNINAVDQLQDMWKTQQAETTELLKKSGAWSKEAEQSMNDSIVYITQTLPSIFIMSGIAVGFIIVVLNFWLAKKLRHDVPRFGKFSTMLLPMSVVFIYAVLLLIALFGGIDESSQWYLMLLNATVIFRALFFIQGLAFIKFMTEHFDVNKGLTVILFVIAVIFNPLTVLLGILDIGFRRSWVQKK